MSPLIFSLLFKDFLGCSRSFEFPWELEGRFINFYKEASGDSDGLGRSWPVTLLKMDFFKEQVYIYRNTEEKTWRLRTPCPVVSRGVYSL